jgi:hypothetical protein
MMLACSKALWNFAPDVRLQLPRALQPAAPCSAPLHAPPRTPDATRTHPHVRHQYDRRQEERADARACACACAGRGQDRYARARLSDGGADCEAIRVPSPSPRLISLMLTHMLAAYALLLLSCILSTDLHTLLLAAGSPLSRPLSLADRSSVLAR